MPNKHFCQGPHCHTRVTSDRFLKSRGVIRGRYALLDMEDMTMVIIILITQINISVVKHVN